MVSGAVIVAAGANGHSEAEPLWVDFLRGLARYGLRGAQFVVSDARATLKVAIIKVIHATWQRCRAT